MYLYRIIREVEGKNTRRRREEEGGNGRGKETTDRESTAETFITHSVGNTFNGGSLFMQ